MNPSSTALMLAQKELEDANYRIHSLLSEHRLLRHKKFREENLLILRKNASERTQDQQERISDLIAARQNRSAILSDEVNLPKTLRSSAFTRFKTQHEGGSENNNNNNEKDNSSSKNNNNNKKKKDISKPIKSALSKVIDSSQTSHLPRQAQKGVGKCSGKPLDQPPDAFFMNFDTTEIYSKIFEMETWKAEQVKQEKERKAAKESNNENKNNNSSTMKEPQRPSSASKKIPLRLTRRVVTSSGAQIPFDATKMLSDVSEKDRFSASTSGTNSRIGTAEKEGDPKKQGGVGGSMMRKGLASSGSLIVPLINVGPRQKLKEKKLQELNDLMRHRFERMKRKNQKIKKKSNDNNVQEADSDDSDDDDNYYGSELIRHTTRKNLVPPQNQIIVDSSKPGPERRYIRCGQYLVADRRRDKWKEADDFFINSCPPRKPPPNKSVAERGFGLLKKDLEDGDVSELTVTTVSSKR